MESKIDNLTQKIYQEGIEKANQEGERIINNAKLEAERILRQAKEDAENIKKNGEKEAEEIKRNNLASLKLAGTQALSSLKQQIKDLLALKILKEPVKQSFVDASFIKELILSITKNWNPEEGATINLSPALEAKIDKVFEASIRKEIDKLTINYDNRLINGFSITPHNGSFQITFTEQDFVEFFKPFIREKADKLLFEKE